MSNIVSKNLISKLFWVAVFGIAMGFLEAIVVVYLRDLYYPGGFGFPMSPVSPQMYFAELIRETATLMMLLSLGFLVGKTGIQRLAYFLISFAAWDIIYYVALKLLLDWPQNLMTWDVLFLIPLPWLGPVIAPVIVSLTMIWIGASILLLEDRNGPVVLNTEEWGFWMTGTLVLFASFIWNYSSLIVKHDYTSKILTLTNNPDFLNIVYNYTPEKFNWILFIIGECIVIIGTLRLLYRYRSVIEHTGKNVLKELNHARQQLFQSH